jgi:hypothetical protein
MIVYHMLQTRRVDRGTCGQPFPLNSAPRRRCPTPRPVGARSVERWRHARTSSDSIGPDEAFRQRVTVAPVVTAALPGSAGQHAIATELSGSGGQDDRRPNIPVHVRVQPTIHSPLCLARKLQVDEAPELIESKRQAHRSGQDRAGGSAAHRPGRGPDLRLAAEDPGVTAASRRNSARS